DIDHSKLRKVRRTAPKSEDLYLKLLVQLYRFLSRRTRSNFNEIVLKRLYMSRAYCRPMSLAKLIRHMRHPERRGKFAVIIGTITDDVRIFNIPKLKICALHVTERARGRILKAGGEILTLDQLALRSPRGQNTVLLQGVRTSRKVFRHFGKAPGTPHANTKPYVRCKGRKFEMARGHRKSRAYKN
ncbi:hypothetical protein, partial [Salmonella sp. s54395]|uniref:hypothetical protein n=2 Tax=unclassified Salmonella TaxID=2614656 RepID=UPI00397FA184